MEEQSKKKLLVAVLLGLLTFVVTPVIAIVVGIPFFFLGLGKVSESFNPIVIIANIFGLRELGGFFAAQFILIGLLSLLGDFGTAIISWLINRSKKLATVTFVSALILQFAAVVIVLPITIKESQRTMKAGIEREKSFEQYAEIGNVSFDVREPYSDIEMDNHHPEYGPIYKKLEIIVPVSVSHAGTYQVTAQYSFSKDGSWGNTPMKDAIQNFGAGNHEVRIEFLANEGGGSYGYWSPESVGGRVEVQLSYLASQKELIESLKSDNTIDEEMLQRFMKAEGLDKEISSKPTVNKYVGRKGVKF